jgi:predicted nuclease of predicted toxin-antitoxin system
LRVLLDEMLDRRLKRHLPEGTDAMTVRERGWGSKKNGELLALAQTEFDVLLTADRGIPDQQDLSRFDLAVVVLRAQSNRYRDLAPLMEESGAALERARPGEAVLVGGDRGRGGGEPL